MIKQLLIDYIWILILALTILYTLIKFIVIGSFNFKKKSISLYLFSIRNINRYIIETAEGSAIKRYYKISNNINTLFFVTGLVTLFMFFLFRYS